jgi:hypothetical protein
MALFLLKPHITGPGGEVTSPDVIVDQIVLDADQVALHRLTHEAWQQCAEGASARAAYALMALGGGTLLLPAVVFDCGPIVAARCAWRLSALADHLAQVTLNGVPLPEIGAACAPATSIAAMPRGRLVVQTVVGQAASAVLEDHKLARVLSHKVVIESLGSDRWGPTGPEGRYSVGPTRKDVQHYI